MAETLREQFRREMIVRGKSDLTQDAYLRNVELLVRRTGKHPAKLSTNDLRDYFVKLVDKHQVAPATYRQHLAAIRLFYEAILGREERLLEYASPRKSKKLPVVLTIDETHRTLNALCVPRIRAAAVVAYSCGLRKSEIIALSSNWITAEAGSLHIHNAKGGVDRVVPLPERTLAILREHWRREQPSGKLLFESPNSPTRTFSGDTVRRAIKIAAKSVGINRPVSLHTLRHCYASHLLEHGVALPLIQRWMGHKNISTTMVYVHIAPASLRRGQTVLAKLTEPL